MIQTIWLTLLLISFLCQTITSLSHMNIQTEMPSVMDLRSLLFKQLRRNTSGSTQRWVGAQSKHDGNNINHMECNFTVPSDSSIDKFPVKGTGEAHYIYCDLHHFWPDKVFGQFVPQLMRGECVTENDSSYAIKDTWLDRWYIQSQYIWNTPEGRVKGYVGKLLPVSPGQRIYTRIYYGQDEKGIHSYCLQISADSGPISQLVVTVPFMGTNPAYTAPYGSDKAISDYYKFVLGDLHEAWNMNEPKFYPNTMNWNVNYNGNDGTDAEQSIANSCTDHSTLLKCSNNVMVPTISLNSHNHVQFNVSRVKKSVE